MSRKTVLSVLNTKMGIIPSAIEINALKGDASNRSYYRLRYRRENRPTTIVVMQLAKPEAFKASEEAVSTSTIPVRELPYINILRHLTQWDIPVPRLYYYDPSAGLLFLEDLGDRTLEGRLKDSKEETVRRFYRLAIDELLKIQGPVTQHPSRNCIAFGRAFDVSLLMWEFDHFLEYGVEAQSGIPMKAGDRKKIRSEFMKIGEALAAEPRVFTHRDYHSRNLMVHRHRLYLLDFQDALMGPCVYDLSSLLRDSYTVLGEPMVDELIGYYLEQKKEAGLGRPARAAFRRLFDLMSIQRNLKAAGRFVYISIVKKKDHLLPYIPQTLGYVRRSLDRYSELKRLRDALRPYLEELR